jgi:flagellar protein FliL
MKLYMKSLIIIAVITTVGVGGFAAWHYMATPAPAKAKANADEPSIDEVLNQSIEVGPITTNLKDGGIIKTKFELVCSSAKSAEEVKKVSFQIESTIIQYLSGVKKEDLVGANGLDSLEGNVKRKLNQALGSEVIKRVYTTDKLIQ